MAAAALRWSAKTTPSRSSTQGLVSQLRSSRRRWIAKPCLGARFRASTAVIREGSHNASTTASSNRHTDAVSFSTGPAAQWIGPVPAYWDQSGAAYCGCPGSVPAYWNLPTIFHPDLIATILPDVPSFTLRTALSAIPFVSDLCGVDVQ